jgi:hypothetical protein
LRRTALDELIRLAWLTLEELRCDGFGRPVSLNLFELSATDFSDAKKLKKLRSHFRFFSSERNVLLKKILVY